MVPKDVTLSAFELFETPALPSVSSGGSGQKLKAMFSFQHWQCCIALKFLSANDSHLGTYDSDEITEVISSSPRMFQLQKFQGNY